MSIAISALVARPGRTAGEPGGHPAGGEGGPYRRPGSGRGEGGRGGGVPSRCGCGTRAVYPGTRPLPLSGGGDGLPVVRCRGGPLHRRRKTAAPPDPERDPLRRATRSPGSSARFARERYGSRLERPDRSCTREQDRQRSPDELTSIRQEPHGIPGDGNGESMRPARQPAATHPNSGWPRLSSRGRRRRRMVPGA